MSDEERSGSGSPIYRHTEVAPESRQIAQADDERISGHLEKNIGPLGMVFHEIVSDRIHIDIHRVPASEAHPYQVIATSGMSALAMTVPAELEDGEQWRHAELCMILPADWPLEEAALKDDRNYWPIRLLKQLARLPHDFSTWLGWGHSIPNGDPPEPYAPGTDLCGAVLIPPFLLGADFFTLPGEPSMHIFQVLPVTAGEMQLKLDKGLDEMLEHMEKQIPDVYGPLDPARPSAV
ncbi:MAG: suppressor of fused domain protein [Deltaproteobacteria bacterium]|nr:suppressor of fused domain protein [Deltaproteobacteria bacterium]